MAKNLSLILLLIVVILACRPESETDAFWDGINTKNKYQPFTFALTSSQIETCASISQPTLTSMLNAEFEGIDNVKINASMMFSSIEDPQYSNIAEELKFLFDLNGNNTFTNYPAFVNNLTCFNTDTASFFESIRTQINSSPKIKLGIKTVIDNNDLNIYVKGEYQDNVTNNHSIAIYIYRKSEWANQVTPSGTESTRFKNKIISATTPTVGFTLAKNNKGETFRKTGTFTFSSENLSNLGVLAIVYNLENNKPFEVLNSLKSENF